MDFAVRHPHYLATSFECTPPTSVAVKLDPGATIEERVIYGATGVPAAGVVVEAQYVNRQEASATGAGRAYFVHAETDAEGRYKLEGIAGARYNV